MVWSGLVLAEIENMVSVFLPKRLMSQFQPVQKNKQQALRAYCPNKYVLFWELSTELDIDRHLLGWFPLAYVVGVPVLLSYN